MTRINLIDPALLSDQHLMAEYREMPMVPSALRRSLRTKTVEQILKSIPDKFTLNTGHVRFFYNKLFYLQNRYIDVRDELTNRGFKLDYSRPLGVQDIPSCAFFGDYTPTEEAVKIITARINEKIQMKPHWYRYKGEYVYG